MIVLNSRNVHEALPLGIKLLLGVGVQRESRNGPVLQAPCPVTTVYEKPIERVVFWKERDANPFFHLYESLWMLAGRNDIAPLTRYAKNMINFSDDGVIQHGAYGHRWRWKDDGFSRICHFDQLAAIAIALINNKDDRRAVLQMWNSDWDLGKQNAKDVPCNLTATFQINTEGKLDLTVFCRSNDIIWGAYGANAVHFSMLLEYMSLWVGVAMGKYYQISINWHGYLATLEPINHLHLLQEAQSPYEQISPISMAGDIGNLDAQIKYILAAADARVMAITPRPLYSESPWAHMVYTVLEAHEVYRINEGEKKYLQAISTLLHTQECDWTRAAKEWFERRYQVWLNKQALFNGGLTHR